VKRGPIHYRDGNQNEHLAESVPVEKKFYPYRDAVRSLMNGSARTPTNRVYGTS
jgi:hypothetical protein